jgi:hypothetical protein
MENMTLLDIKLGMAIGIFIVGVLSFAIGIYFLIARSAGKEVRALANQTAQLAKKGLALSETPRLCLVLRMSWYAPQQASAYF